MTRDAVLLLVLALLVWLGAQVSARSPRQPQPRQGEGARDAD